MVRTLLSSSKTLILTGEDMVATGANSEQTMIIYHDDAHIDFALLFSVFSVECACIIHVSADRFVVCCMFAPVGHHRQPQKKIGELGRLRQII